jgi:predicted nucleic acid-binding protein
LNTDVWTSLRRYKPEKRKQRLQRRPDEELNFIERIDVTPGKLLYDTTVYIDILQDRFPRAGDFVLGTADAWHSPVTEAELAVLAGLLDPAHPDTRRSIDEIAIGISRRAIDRTIVPGIVAWREAGILSGILARLQGYDKSQRLRLMNDALLFVTARRHGCTVLTRNVSDFDFLQQLEPAGRVLFYRV